jgi:EAL and modified HD-GYP domain-containing signal transduction protein
MKIFTARQAILDKENKVMAYELLYRDGEENSFPMNIDPHAATGRIIVRTHLNEGLSNITGGKTAFINFTEKCLLSDLPEMLPKDKVVIEILESVNPTDAVYEKCRALYKKGYRLALDDFVYKSSWARFLKLVRIIKFDITKTPLHTLPKFINSLREMQRKGNLKNKIALLAERVETHEEFELAKKLGFHFFQGYYFCKPEMHASKDVDLNSSSLLSVYQELCKKELNINAITKCFESDEGLTYKLLNFMNSGLFSVESPISSIKQALTYLGEEKLRRFLTLLTTSQMAVNKPKELVRVGIVRARTNEGIAEKVLPAMTNEAFLAGLLSILPGILDRPIGQILENLPVTEEISDALLPKVGKPESTLRIVLKVTELIEKGSWHLTTKECLKLKNISYDDVNEIHTDALGWAKQFEDLDQ